MREIADSGASDDTYSQGTAGAAAGTQADDSALHPSAEELEAGLAFVLRSPSDHGLLDLIVRRPAPDEREVLTIGVLDLDKGLVGDTWRVRGSRRTTDGGPHPEMQLNVINARLANLVAKRPERRQLAGDQLFLDLDLSHENLPAGTRLAIGAAVIEVTDQPHNGCAKFSTRFGRAALRFVNSDQGKRLGLRGRNAKVTRPGLIRPGDRVRKV